MKSGFHGKGNDSVKNMTIKNILSEFKIGQPAARALASIGIYSLKQLTEVTEIELMELHGFGPKALRLLKEALLKAHLDFKK
jgi:DNA-directed RNA polymerase alpha subunit